MIRRVLNINNYWKVIIYFNIDYSLSSIITKELIKIGCTKSQIETIYYNMFHKHSKAVTISSSYYKTSVVLFNKHKTQIDYINSVVHESEHIKQSILSSYNVKDYGEAPAYTVGYIASQLLMFLFHL